MTDTESTTAQDQSYVTVDPTVTAAIIGAWNMFLLMSGKGDSLSTMRGLT